MTGESQDSPSKERSRALIERWATPVGAWRSVEGGRRCQCGESVAPCLGDADGSALVLCGGCECLWRWRTDPEGRRWGQPVRLLLDAEDARRVVVRDSAASRGGSTDAWDHRVHWSTILGLPGVARRVLED